MQSSGVQPSSTAGPTATLPHPSGTRVLGWEVARTLELERPSMWQRLQPGAREIRAAAWSLVTFTVLLLGTAWFLSSPNGPGAADPASGRWTIFWAVVVLAALLEFLDASAGMGYGTAITPLLLVFGFEPIQIVPAVMIQQATAGLLGAFLHHEFGNVEWRVKPMSETLRLALLVTFFGCLAVAVSTTAVYALLKLASVWIKLYVAVLLVGMGVISLFSWRRSSRYRPLMMVVFGAVAGFNKGIGGGGYGPVVTVGGLLSGVPAKSMMAVTALSEGLVCVVSIGVWAVMTARGLAIDFVLLPSMLLGSMLAAVAAPWSTRVLPERCWRIVVPVYCCLLASYCLAKALTAFVS